MLVDFERISIKGFLSIGEADVDLADQGMVFVTGRNESPGNQDSNGAGKSTIFEAIMYALTGSTLRGTKDVVNIYWKGYTEVTLTMSVDGVNYVIMRTRDHPEYKNNLKIWRDGEDISGVGLKKSEEILKSELGQLTSSLISSVIILGQGLPNKFTDLSPIARKDRLEELSQSSEFIGEFKTRLANFKDLYMDKSSKNNVEIARTETSITMNEGRVSESVAKLEELRANAGDIEDLKESLSKVQSELASLDGSLTMVTQMRGTTNEASSRVQSDLALYESQRRDSSSQISRIMTELANLEQAICPTCHQPIQSQGEIDSLRAEREERIAGLQGVVGESVAQIAALRGKADLLAKKLRDIDEKYQTIYQQMNVKNRERVELEGRIAQLSGTSKELRETIDVYSSKIADDRARLKEMSDTRGVYDLKLGILDYLTKKSSKEFRSFMLTGVIEYLNSKLIQYSQSLFGTTRLSLVLDGNRISIIYDNRPYENLSGGERQRADLAMQFSLRDMLMNSLGFDCNLLIIDEGFDNLDGSGVDSLISVINGMSSIDSVFTISHHTLSLPFDKTIEVVKGLDKVSTVHETF